MGMKQISVMFEVPFGIQSGVQSLWIGLLKIILQVPAKEGKKMCFWLCMMLGEKSQKSH